jgi:single-strand DNA-binding protein
MASLNRVLLIGNLTRDPELRYIPSGAAVANLRLAVNSTFKDQAGQRKEETCFVTIVVWGKQAETCNQYLKKGRSVFVEGRLIYRSWEAEGKTRSTMEVRADRVQFLGGPGGASGPREEPAAGEGGRMESAEVEAAPEGSGDADVPF